MASLNGHEAASKHALLLERFLTTQEIELATSSVQALMPEITNRYRRQLAAQQSRVDTKKAELDKINNEIDTMLGLKPAPESVEKPNSTLAQVQAQKAVPTGAIFTTSDRMK